MVFDIRLYLHSQSTYPEAQRNDVLPPEWQARCHLGPRHSKNTGWHTLWLQSNES